MYFFPHPALLHRFEEKKKCSTSFFDVASGALEPFLDINDLAELVPVGNTPKRNWFLRSVLD